MMRSFLLHYPGRIGRGEFWLAFAIAAVVNLIVTFAVFFLIAWQFGWPVTGVFTSENFRISFGGGGAKFFAERGPVVAFIVGLISTAQWLAFLFPASIRRRHDRGVLGWDVVILSAVQIALCFSAFWSKISIVDIVLGWVSQFGTLYLIVVLGFLPGNREANAFGADPRSEARLEPAAR